MLRKPNRYAVLLRVRRHEENARALALSQATVAVQSAEANRSVLIERHDEVLKRASEAVLGTNAALMDEFSSYERHVTRLIAHADTDIARLRLEQGSRQAEFDASRQRRKMIDQLMDRTRARWQDHVLREERKAIEDSAVMRHARNRAEESLD